MIAGIENPLGFSDTFVQNANTGIILSATYLNGLIQMQYTSTNTGIGAQLKYLVTVSA
jgi:hypothetical protein